MASGYPFPVFAFTDIYRKKLFHQIDERERAFQSKFAVDFELEGHFFVHFFVSGVDVRSAAVVELGRIGIERKVDAQRRADDGDFCHDVAFASICVALFADAALDLGRAFLGCGERVLQNRVAFLDDIVGKRVFFGESEALACSFFRHNFVIVEFLPRDDWISVTSSVSSLTGAGAGFGSFIFSKADAQGIATFLSQKAQKSYAPHISRP